MGVVRLGQNKRQKNQVHSLSFPNKEENHYEENDKKSLIFAICSYLLNTHFIFAKQTKELWRETSKTPNKRNTTLPTLLGF